MKIVVLGLRGFPGIQGGVETHCEHLYPRIAALGHTIVVLCRKPYVVYPEALYRGVRLVPLACPRSKSLEAFVHTFVGVFAAWRMKPDILHIHAIGPALMVPLARFLGMRVVYTNHGPDYDRQKWGRAARTLLRLGESVGSRFANGIVAVSRPIADHLQRAFGRTAAVIPNGVVVRAGEPGVETLRRFGLEKGRYVLGVGRLVPEKGFHDLLDAFTSAEPEGWKLVIAGRADHQDDYSVRLLCKAAELAGVVMTGFVDGVALRELYSHAGLFVLPSYHEGLPIVLLEALGYGLPVAVSDIPANRQVGLTEERFFPAGDIDRASECIVRFAANPPTDAQRASQIAVIEREFDWDTIALRTLEFYKTLPRGERTRPSSTAAGDTRLDSTDRP